MRLVEKLLGRNFPMGDRLGSSVVEMNAITQVLEQQLSPESRTPLEKLDSLSRNVRIVRLTMERHTFGPPHARIFGSPESSTFDDVMSALSQDSPIKQLVESRPTLEAKRSVLLMALIRGLGHEMQRTIDDHLPNNDALLRYSETLPPQEQQRLNGLSRDERFLELQLRYLKEQIPGIGEFQEILVMPVMDKFFRETIQRLPNPGQRGAKIPLGPPDASERPANNQPPKP
jgi:hypothetical protein